MVPATATARRCPLGADDDSLCALNKAFRDAYAGVQTSLLQSGAPIIISRSDQVILLRGGHRLTGQTIGDLYHRLKTVAHVPLAVHVLLYPGAGRPLDEKTRSALDSLLKLITEARDRAQIGLSAEQAARQRALLDNADAFIKRALKDGQVTGAAVQAYTRGSADQVLANAREAAESQLETLHEHVTGWLADMTPEERERLSVVIQVGHMPRIGSVTSQYFSALLGEPYEGRFDVENPSPGQRVIVTEARANDERLLHLLSTHVIDSRIGTDFFADGDIMHRDLLADATEAWLIRKLDATPVPPCGPGSPTPQNSRPRFDSE